MQLLADAAPWIFGGLGIVAGLAVLLVILLLTIFWIWMIIEAITNHALDDTERLVWVLVIFFSHFIGSILYFVLVRSKRARPDTSLTRDRP